MNWDAISFDWNQVRAFLATVEEGSFSGAARVLDSTQPTVGRQVTGLEEHLGLILLERTVKGPVLTEAGQELLEHVSAMGQAAALISMVASGQSEDVTGKVSITASDMVASEILPAMLIELQSIAPGVKLEIIASNDIMHLGQREADIAIRHVRPEQPDLIAKHIADFRANYYAAIKYLEQAGKPRAMQELAEHRFVGSDEIELLIGILQSRGVSIRPEQFVAFSGSGTAMLQMTRSGFGIALLPEAICDADPRLEKAVDDCPPIEFPVWLVTHRELRTNQRIRLVFDLLSRKLKQYAIDTSAVGH